MSTEKMTLAKWYGNSVRVPSYRHSSFRGFVSSSIGIVRSILKKEAKRDVHIHFMKGGTASADQERGVININQDYLVGEVKDRILDSDTSISLILGLIVHEAAHFAYSPATLVPFMDYVKDNTKHTYHARVAGILGNIVEDIFIEAEIDRRVPSLTWMLDCSNGIFFSTQNRDATLADSLPLDTPPLKLNDVAKILDTLVYAKTLDSIETNDYIAKLFDMVHGAKEALTLESRQALVLSLYELLMPNIDEEAEEEGNSEGGDGASEPSDGSGSGLGQSEEMARGLTSPHDSDGEEVEESDTGLAILVERNLESTVHAEVKIVPDDTGFTSTTEVYVEQPLDRVNSPVISDKRYARLAEIGRQRAVVNRPYGMDMNRGNTIRKLHRIATDGKIFAQPLTMNNYKPMQVILLVDCSGSMMCRTDKRTTRLQEALQATLGAATALVDARCDVAVYGHTSHVIDNEVVIYKGKEFNESIDGLDMKLGDLLGERSTSQNKDGYAIKYVSNKFNTMQKRRLLIVISDGEPSAPDYMGWSATRHSKACVDAVRQKGIDVLSISITEEAQRSNDYIYGESWNVYNEDPNVIEDIVKAMLLK